MTGIAALFSAGPASQQRLDRMVAAMEQRARDGSATWVKGSFGLGAAMLHTTAESLEAPQPHTSEDASLALVMDGYLTNWEELRADLLQRGAKLRNLSDAELVLRAYELWGEDCAARIEGEFAFIIADTRAHRLYAARDHQGLRPLYFYRHKDALLIASDIAAIIAALDPIPAPNFDYLANVAIRQYWLREQTPWQGVTRLLQSQFMVAHQPPAAPHIRRYYDLPVAITQRYASDGEYVEHYRAMLFDAVRRTSRTHLPLAVAVSGGLDSSALYGISHLLEGEGKLLAPSLQGYTFHTTPDMGAYELPYARAAAEHIGRSLIEVPLFKPDEAWFRQQAAIDCDVPIPTNGAMSRLLEQRVAADGSRAYMQGTGGDEWLQGSTQYYREFLEEGRLLAFGKALVRDSQDLGFGPMANHALRIGASGFLPPALRTWLKARRRTNAWQKSERAFWLRPEWRARVSAHEAAYDAALPRNLNAWLKLNRFSSAYGEFAKSRMQLQNAQSGIESRHPMFTRQFIEFSTTTPECIKRQGFGYTKVTHRAAMRGVLPDYVVDRRSKVHFESDAIDDQFCEFVAANGAQVLSELCDRADLARFVEVYRNRTIDEEWSWEIWGAYAVAAFLTNVRNKTLLAN